MVRHPVFFFFIFWVERWSHTFLDAPAAGNSVHSFVGAFISCYLMCPLIQEGDSSGNPEEDAEKPPDASWSS